MIKTTKTKFYLDDVYAAQSWNFNCGPAAIAAILDMTPAELRPHLCDFEKKKYTNPRLMYKILNGLGVEYRKLSQLWPGWGLVRVQWLGPWTEPGVPNIKRQRHTHWIGSFTDKNDIFIYDINCMCVGGWVTLAEWRDDVVPWLLNQVEPDAYGTWEATHSIEVSGLKDGVF